MKTTFAMIALPAGLFVLAAWQGTIPATLPLTKAYGGTGADNSSVTFPSSGTLLTAPTGSSFTAGAGLLSAQYSASDSVSCPNNTTSNFATTYTIPANYLTANKTLRLTLGMGLISTGGPQMAVNLLIGGTSVYAPGATIPGTTSTSTAQTGITFLIQGTAAAGASVGVETDAIMPTSIAVNFSPFNRSTTVQPVNLATNGTLVIQPQLFCSANTAGNSVILRQMIVEALN